MFQFVPTAPCPIIGTTEKSDGEVLQAFPYGLFVWGGKTIFAKFSTIPNFSHAKNEGGADTRSNNITLSICNTMITLSKSIHKYSAGGGSIQGNKLVNIWAI